MTSVELRDHAAEMLTAIVEDLGTGPKWERAGQEVEGPGASAGHGGEVTSVTRPTRDSEDPSGLG